MTRTYCKRRLLCLTGCASKTGFHFSWIFGGFDHVDIIFLVYMTPSLLPVFLWHLTNTLQRRAHMNLNLSLMSSCKVLEDFVESGGGKNWQVKVFSLKSMMSSLLETMISGSLLHLLVPFAFKYLKHLRPHMYRISTRRVSRSPELTTLRSYKRLTSPHGDVLCPFGYFPKVNNNNTSQTFILFA